MFLSCSQQGIIRLPLTGLKQCLPFAHFNPTLLVILTDNVFLCFASVWSFTLLALSYSHFLMVSLCFGLPPPLVGLSQSYLILKFHLNAVSLSGAVIYEEMHLDEKV